MSEYVYESGMSTQRRKQRRTAITLMLTLLLLFGAFWWAWAYIRADEDPTPTSGPSGTTAPACAANPKDVTINVYNSTTVAGLAGRAASQIEDAGFTIGTIANDPEGVGTSPSPVVLRYGPEAEAYAFAFRDHYLPTVRMGVPREREGTDLDIVLGEGFEQFQPFPNVPDCE